MRERGLFLCAVLLALLRQGLGLGVLGVSGLIPVSSMGRLGMVGLWVDSVSRWMEGSRMCYLHCCCEKQKKIILIYEKETKKIIKYFFVYFLNFKARVIGWTSTK